MGLGACTPTALGRGVYPVHFEGLGVPNVLGNLQQHKLQRGYRGNEDSSKLLRVLRCFISPSFSI
jgi:hypothetical protein